MILCTLLSLLKMWILSSADNQTVPSVLLTSTSFGHINCGFFCVIYNSLKFSFSPLCPSPLQPGHCAAHGLRPAASTTVHPAFFCKMAPTRCPCPALSWRGHLRVGLGAPAPGHEAELGPVRSVSLPAPRPPTPAFLLPSLPPGKAEPRPPAPPRLLAPVRSRGTAGRPQSVAPVCQKLCLILCFYLSSSKRNLFILIAFCFIPRCICLSHRRRI